MTNWFKLIWAYFSEQDLGDNAPPLWRSYRMNLPILNEIYNMTDAARNLNQKPQDVEIIPLLDPGPTKGEGALSAQRRWQNLYEVEQRLVPYLPDSIIDAEFTRRYIEAGKLGVASAEEIKKSYEATGDNDRKRMLYAGLLDDLHFRYSKRALDRLSRKKAARQLNLAGSIITLLLLAMIVYFEFFLEPDSKSRFYPELRASLRMIRNESAI